MHFIDPVLTVAAFSILKAVVLVVATGGIGLAVGAVFALLWNVFHGA
jgi:hypothetical protein